MRNESPCNSLQLTLRIQNEKANECNQKRHDGLRSRRGRCASRGIWTHYRGCIDWVGDRFVADRCRHGTIHLVYRSCDELLNYRYLQVKMRLDVIMNGILEFGRDDEGAQVVEYGLI